MNPQNKRLMELLRDPNQTQDIAQLWHEVSTNAVLYCIFYKNTNTILKFLITYPDKKLFAFFTDIEEFKSLHMSSTEHLVLKPISFNEWLKCIGEIDFDGIIINPTSDRAVFLLDCGGV